MSKTKTLACLRSTVYACRTCGTTWSPVGLAPVRSPVHCMQHRYTYQRRRYACEKEAVAGLARGSGT
jgi:hypothetical protein